jgi:hypothetical protein
MIIFSLKEFKALLVRLELVFACFRQLNSIILDGVPGTKGKDASVGLPGPIGDVGSEGATGVDGFDGPDGEDV